MVSITVQGDRVRFEIEGWDKLWALKGHLEIPIAHITGVRADPDAAKGWWHGLRLPGADIPGVLVAGSFLRHGRMIFYDVHDTSQAIVVELDHEDYDRLVVEVRDPAAAVHLLSQAIAKR